MTKQPFDFEQGYYKLEHEIEQILGKALGYPAYKDSPEIFGVLQPDDPHYDDVCVGDHVSITIAMEAASVINKLRASQCKIPLLPLPPVEERGDTEYFLIDHNGHCDKCVYSNQYAGIGWYAAADMNYNGTDKDWLGYLPPFTVVDGHIVFEVL